MKILREQATKKVRAVFNDEDYGEFVVGGFRARDRLILDTKSLTHEVVFGPEPKLTFIPGHLTYDNGQWGVVDESAYREALNNSPDYVATVKAQAEKRAAEIIAKEQIAAKIDDMPDEDKATLAYLYDEWSGEGVALKTGDIVRVADIPYRVLQDHTTQPDWTPDTVASLFTPLRQTQGAAPDEWVQPTGGHDAYNTGDRVTFNGAVYESLIDSNTWSPAAYPAGWQLVE